MKTPSSLGLPSKFQVWRKGQLQAVQSLLYSDDRFSTLVTPTGSGKSATLMSYAQVDRARAAFITMTKHLMNQYGKDFAKLKGEAGLFDMRGRANYICEIDEERTAETAVCTVGTFCRLMKEPGCEYYDRLRKAKESRLLLTNYSFWLHAEESGKLGQFSTLVLDEAHRAPDAIGEYAAVELTDEERVKLALLVPRKGAELADWALRSAIYLESRTRDENGHGMRRLILRAIQKMRRLCRLSTNEWIESPLRRRGKVVGWRWDLIDPGALAEDLLFRGATRVILSSASVRRKTLRLLGVTGKVHVVEQSSTFPIKRRPIYYWPVARMNRKSSAEDLARVYQGIDRVIGSRLDRKGLVHSVSYDRAKDIVRNSRYRDRSEVWLLHERGRELSDFVQEFEERGPGTVAVSPAMTEGVDLPDRLCEYIVIPKMPFPDFSSPLMRARAERDKDYTAYLTMQTLVQMVGRGMRSETDQCETVILDSAFGWLRGQFYDFAPMWFWSAVKSMERGAEGVPPPPPPLGSVEV